jgi:asparagine synthase (glutamine-hydrolysing)
MCGIAGCFERTARTGADRLSHVARSMADTLVHRGPDEGAVWIDPAHGIALAHRRLSILDLSSAGSQPMSSARGRYVIVWNGEIYNHAELRAELALAGSVFRGHSDTEVLLEAIAAWGIQRTLERANGMFALAVWDSAEQVLTLARDRLGIKPLYYGWLQQQFLFASELKALRAHPDFCPLVDRAALAQFLQHGYIPTPATIYEGVHKLAPGCLLTISRAAATPAPRPFWSLRAAIETGRANPFRGTEAEAADELEALLRDAVALQRLADVPVGAFLSGGIDSSLVVALMRAQNAGSVRAFTIGFSEPEFDELEYARAIAAHLQLDHTATRIGAEQARQVISRLPHTYDEPFADVSQIPTLLVSELARQKVTVSLSGDGGDELLGGYGRYERIDSFWRKIGWLPATLRRRAAQLYQRVVHQALRGKSGTSFRSRVLAAADRKALYDTLHRHWETPAELVIGSTPLPADPWLPHWIASGSFIEEMMALDTATYLPDCILTKLDRASMAVSLEARVPLLDHRVVEFAWRLPREMKFRAGQGKRLLRIILARHLPPRLFERPKRGFGVPIGDWLRGPLRTWAEELLDDERLRAEGFLRPEPIREKWAEHQSGRCNWQYLLWDVLMFQSWLQAQRS